MDLLPLDRTHAPAMLDLRVRNREHFLTGEPVRPDRFFTLEGQREALATAEDERAAGTREAFAIVEDDTIVGYVALSQIFRGSFQNAYLGYAVDHEHGGRGVATRAVAAAVEHAWDLGLHRVQANVLPENAASRRVLEKNGFRHEGTALRYLDVGGRWADHELFAITVEERR